MKNEEILKKYSRTLRNNETEEEKKLWYQFLNKLSIRFWRQKVVGDYIVDFCCPKAKIIIELDGSQHYEEASREKDTLRDTFLSSLGYTILRYTNLQVHTEFKAICEDIWNHLPPPVSPAKGRG